MKQCSVDILGAIYTITYGNKEEYPALETCDGYTDTSCGLIVIDDMGDSINDVNRKQNIKAYQHQVARHEVLHAFLYESGLSDNTFFDGAWATNEEMIDWFAIQFVKIKNVYEKLGII